MTISHTGLLYHSVYFFTPINHRPKQVNLCPFFWRALFNLLIFLPTYWLLIVPLGFVVSFFFSKYPSVFPKKGCGSYWCRYDCTKEQTDDFVDYKWWPTLAGVRLWPVTLMVFIVISTAFYRIWHMPDGPLAFAIAFGVIFGAVLLVFLVVGVGNTLKSETAQVATEWIKANKSKYCPIIKVV